MNTLADSMKKENREEKEGRKCAMQ